MLVYLTDKQRQKESLRKLARRHGLFKGDNPNISGLIQAIADGVLEVSEATCHDCDTCSTGCKQLASAEK